MKRSIELPLLMAVLTALLLAGCGGSPKVAEPTPLQPVAHPAVHPAVAWRSSGGSGDIGQANGFRLAIENDTGYVANADGGVAALNISNGRTLWHANAGVDLVSGPTVAGQLLLVGTRNGHLLALEKDGGKQVWSASVGSEVLAPAAANKGIAVVHTADGRLVAYNLDSGSRLWTVERNVPNLTMRGLSAPVILGSHVYAGLDNGHVMALDLHTGKQLWEQTVAVPTGRTELSRLVDIDATPRIANGQLLAISVGGKMASLDPDSGRVHWKQDVASATGVALGQKLAFTTDLDGIVHAVDRRTGNLLWGQDALMYRKLSAPVMFDGYVVVGDYQGYLHWIDPRTGELVGRLNALSSAIRQQPQVVNGRLYVQGAGGDVVAVEAGQDE